MRQLSKVRYSLSVVTMVVRVISDYGHSSSTGSAGDGVLNVDGVDTITVDDGPTS